MSTNDNSNSRRRMRSAGPLIKNLALSAIVFVLCLAVAEGILRAMGYGNVEIYEPDAVLFWRLKPNQNCYTKVDHKPVRINSMGTRGREFSPAKPPNTIRIVSLGDSKTFGWGLRDEETYSARVEKSLEGKFGPAKKIEVINCGVNAWSYPQMAAMFKHRALGWRPDMVILCDANLWTQFSEQSDPAFTKKFMSRVRVKNWLRHFALYHYVVEVQLKDVYERHRTRFVPVDPKQDNLFKEQQQSDPDAFFRKAIEDLCLTALSNRVQPVLFYVPTQTALLTGNDPFEAVRRVKQDVGRKLNVPFLDLGPALRARAKEVYLDGDPVHLNAAGNEIVAEQMFRFINPIVQP